MANNKRKPISYPELDRMEPRSEPRGRHAILRSADEVEADEQMLEIQNAGNPANQQDGIQENKDSRVPALQQSGEPASQHASKQGNQQTSIPANKYSSNHDVSSTKHENMEAETVNADDVAVPDQVRDDVPESEQTGNRARYTKVTYRLSPDAIDAIEEAKSILKRRYKLKVSLEEIAEEAIIAVCREFLENQNTSILVNKIASKQEKQRAAKRAAQQHRGKSWTL